MYQTTKTVDIITMMTNLASFLVKTTLLTLCYCVNSFANCDFDDFPIMDEMSVQTVMGDAVYNNRPMMVRNFIADADYHEVVNYYHKAWDKEYDDSAFGVWHQITTITDDCMMMVQLYSKSGSPSNGRLVISNMPTEIANQEGLGEDIIKPTDSAVASDLVTNDGPKQGRLTILATDGSTSEVANFYLSEMQQAGWTVERQFNEGDARVLVFRKGLNISNILMIPAGNGTQVLINKEIIK